MEVFAEPQMRSERKHPVLRWFLLVVLVLFCSAYLCAFSYARYKREQARQLITDMQQIKIGMKSEDKLQALSVKYGGTFNSGSGLQEPGRANGRYELRISSAFVVIRNHFYHLPGPGRRPWAVLADFDVTDGYLTSARLSTAVLRSDEVTPEGSTWTNLKNLLGNVPPPYVVVVPVVTGPPTESLDVQLGPEATAEEVKRAFDFNLRCLTRLRECKHVCEVMPSAWEDLPPGNRMRYPDGRERAIDTECRAAIARQGR